VKSTVTSAKSTVYSGTISSELDCSLYGATQAINQLSDGASPNTALYNELGQGAKYGSFLIDRGNSLHTLVFTLNAAAASGVDAAILSKKTAIAIHDLDYDARRIRWVRPATCRRAAARGRATRLP
jgi:hypothetical protein